MKRRVVISGLGAVSPIGNDVDTMWDSIKEGKCGIDEITHFDTSEYRVKLAAEVKDLDMEKYLKKRRYKTKAKLNIYLSIRVPEFDFGRLNEIYKNFPWEQHNHIKTALSKLKNLESDT